MEMILCSLDSSLIIFTSILWIESSLILLVLGHLLLLQLQLLSLLHHHRLIHLGRSWLNHTFVSNDVELLLVAFLIITVDVLLVLLLVLLIVWLLLLVLKVTQLIVRVESALIVDLSV